MTKKKDDEYTVDTNAGDDALQGTIADQDDSAAKAPVVEPDQVKKEKK